MPASQPAGSLDKTAKMGESGDEPRGDDATRSSRRRHGRGVVADGRRLCTTARWGSTAKVREAAT